MNTSSFKGKNVKDYDMGETIAVLDAHSEVINASKGKTKTVTIYALKKTELNPQKFVAYNNAISQNTPRLYPTEIQLIQSQKYIYMIFDHLKKPEGPLDPNQALKQLQAIFRLEKQKIQRDEIFMKHDMTLCYLPSYFKAMAPTSIYSQVHNKQTLATIFCDVVALQSKQKVHEILLSEWENHKVMTLIQPYLTVYPNLEDDDNQIMALMSCIRVNPDMMRQAGQQYIRTSSRRNQGQHSQQISGIFDNVKESMFDIKVAGKDSTQKTKFQIKLNEKKFQHAQFQVYFQGYTQIFRLFKKTIKSYLTKYPKGFNGVISAYLLTLIGILRRLQLICDLQNDEDVFSLGLESEQDYTKYIASLKKELIGEGKMLVNLKQMIENSNFPIKTFETLMPYLDSIENVNRVKTEDFCFFYMTVLLRRRNNQEYHSILAIETMSVLIHRNYEVTYSQPDFPTKWDRDYFSMRKTLIQCTIPNWSID